MNKIHQRRLTYVGLFALGLAIAASFIFYSLKQNMNVFLTPSQIQTAHRNNDYHFRLGGLVKQGSLQHDKTGLGVTFTVTDYKQDLTVRYIGVLPDLFREGKGAIAEGSLNAQGIFVASLVLAKHDENYMPKNVAQSLQQNLETNNRKPS